LDAGTGQAATWNPNASGDVDALALSGQAVYAGGSFTSIGGRGRNNLAALNARTGQATAWNPNAGGDVDALALSGQTLYAGGGFGSIGRRPQQGFAAFRPLPRAPDPRHARWPSPAFVVEQASWRLRPTVSRCSANRTLDRVGGTPRRYYTRSPRRTDVAVATERGA